MASGGLSLSKYCCVAVGANVSPRQRTKKATQSVWLSAPHHIVMSKQFIDDLKKLHYVGELVQKHYKSLENS